MFIVSYTHTLSHTALFNLLLVPCCCFPSSICCATDAGTKKNQSVRKMPVIKKSIKFVKGIWTLEQH